LELLITWVVSLGAGVAIWVIAEYNRASANSSFPPVAAKILIGLGAAVIAISSKLLLFEAKKFGAKQVRPLVRSKVRFRAKQGRPLVRSKVRFGPKQGKGSV
jgi:hypothetical protein